MHWQSQDDKIGHHVEDANNKQGGGIFDAVRRNSSVPECLDWCTLEDADDAGGDSQGGNKSSDGDKDVIEPSLGEDAMIET